MRPHRCQQPWPAHPEWEFRYDFAVTKPSAGPTVTRTNGCATYLTPLYPSSAPCATRMYITHCHWVDLDGTTKTISRDDLVRCFDLLVSRVDWLFSTVDDLETLLNDERYEFKDEAEKCKKELVYERRATVVLSLAWTVGLHLNFIADAERTGRLPSTWTTFPDRINAAELSRLDAPWVTMQLYMYQRRTVTDFAFRVAAYVNKYGLSFGPDTETCLEVGRRLYEEYLEAKLDPRARLDPAPVAFDDTVPPPPYVSVPPERMCGLCGAEVD